MKLSGFFVYLYCVGEECKVSNDSRFCHVLAIVRIFQREENSEMRLSYCIYLCADWSADEYRPRDTDI